MRRDLRARFQALQLDEEAALLLEGGDPRVAGWVAGGCWDDDITSDEMDHSRKFPAFSTSKHMFHRKKKRQVDFNPKLELQNTSQIFDLFDQSLRPTTICSSSSASQLNQVAKR